MLSISQRNFLIKDKVGDKILSNTNAYMMYEILEMFMIAGVAIVQVVYLTRLLEASSIV